MVNIEIPQQQIKEFCRRYRVRELALFGSVLRDDFRPDSDVDVLVVFEPDVQLTLLTLSGMQIELTEILQRSVDLVLRDGLKPIIREDILSSAKTIYAQN
ncbi:MAG: nucleotidyltransferase family protein [Anaerolineae bacterium]|nr:nucleotidyltransferase family protein [Anaerolineae bacterium]